MSCLWHVALVHQPIHWLDNPHLALTDGHESRTSGSGCPSSRSCSTALFKMCQCRSKKRPSSMARRMAEAPPRHRADNPARYRGHSAPRFRVHREGVQPQPSHLTAAGPANTHQLITTWSYNLSFQQFSFGEGAALKQRAAGAGDDLRAGVLVPKPGFLEEQFKSGEMTRLQRSRTLLVAVHAR